jgi:hypothetical protein
MESILFYMVGRGAENEELVGRARKLAEGYANSKRYDEALKVAGKFGFTDIKNKIYSEVDKSIQDNLKLGYYVEAASLANTIGGKEKKKELLEAGVDILEKKGQLFDAGLVAQEAGLYGKAAELFEKDNDFNGAGNAAELGGMFEDAIKFYEKEGKQDQIERVKLKIALKTGKDKELIESYEKEKKFFQLGKAAEEVEIFDKAAEFYEKDGNFTAAGGCAEKAGKMEEAKKLRIKGVETYSRKGDYHAAAVNAESAGMPEKAAEFYLKLNNPIQAIQVLTKAGMKEKVDKISAEEIERLKKKGELEDAAKVAEVAGKLAEAKELYQKGWEHTHEKGFLTAIERVEEEIEERYVMGEK